MRFTFHPMTREFAVKMTEWQYEPPYAIYGYTGGDLESVIEYLTDSGNHFFAVLQSGKLAGFRSFGEDGRVSGGNYSDLYTDTGGGLRPDLTGKGLGREFLRQGLAFGSRQFNTRKFRVTIADFNERARKVCQKVGFKPAGNFKRPTDGEPFTMYTIELKCENARSGHQEL